MFHFEQLSTKFHDIIWCALKKTKHVINSFSLYLVKLQYDIISELMVSMYRCFLSLPATFLYVSQRQTMVIIIMFVGAEPIDISTASTSLACEIPSSDVTILEGHTSEV